MPEYLGPHAERGTETTTYTEPMRAAAKAATLDGAADAKIVAVPEKATAVTATVWPPMAISLLRGAIEGFVLGGLDALTAMSLDFSTRDSLVSAGIIFFARLAIALGVGGIDQWTAAKKRLA